MLKRTLFLFSCALIIAGCTENNVKDPIFFVSEQSIATIVETDGNRLLSVHVVAVNDSRSEIGPFTVEISINDQELQDMIERESMSISSEHTLKSNEKHGYGATMTLKDHVPVEEIRAAIETGRSIEVKLLDKSGRWIATEWIHKVDVVQ